MANLKYISSFILFFGQTWGIKWTVLSDFLAKKKYVTFFMKVCGLYQPQFKRPSITKVNRVTYLHAQHKKDGSMYLTHSLLSANFGVK